MHIRRGRHLDVRCQPPMPGLECHSGFIIGPEPGHESKMSPNNRSISIFSVLGPSDTWL